MSTLSDSATVRGRDVRDELGVLPGEPADWGSTLKRAGLPMCPGVRVAAADPRQREKVKAAVEAVLEEGSVAYVRPLLSTFAAHRRFDALAGLLVPVADREQAEEVVERAMAALGAAEVRSATEQRALCVYKADDSWGGYAASADPDRGDPDVLVVTSYAGRTSEWRLDRRTMRVIAPGHEDLRSVAESAADLADRAQLALGQPANIEWVRSGGRLSVLSISPLSFHATFTQGTFRRVALIYRDEGTTAPVVVDALDRALRRDDAIGDAPRVQRIYARAYRRMPSVSPSGNELPGDGASLGRAASHATQVLADIAAPLTAARRYESSLAGRLASLDRVDLGRVSDGELVAALRAREALLVETLALLDRGREATLACLMGLTAVLGPLPRETFDALASLRPTRARVAANTAILSLAKDIRKVHGDALLRNLDSLDALSPPIRRRFYATMEELGRLRPLGIDARPRAYADSDEALMAALRRMETAPRLSREQERREAMRRLRLTARSRPLGRAREAIVASLLAALGRVTRAKGRVAEGLASVLLRYRAVVCEVGRRLVDMAILERPDDALYLRAAELEEALDGDPGAYGARVRLRREDDARWRRYQPPRRIRGTHREAD